MPRLTRQEAHARTRETLLVTATEHFLDYGYAAASVEKIAEDAGYSKGAIYSNFPNKDELCLAVLDRVRQTKLAAVVSIVDQAASIDDVLTRLRDWADETIGDPRWTLLETEFSARSRHDAHIRERMSAQANQVRTLCAGVITALAERYGVELALPPLEAGTILLSTGIGLGLQRAVTPELSVDSLISVARVLLSSGVPVDGP